jgi:hypothetical protein
MIRRTEYLAESWLRSRKRRCADRYDDFECDILIGYKNEQWIYDPNLFGHYTLTSAKHCRDL